MDYSHDGNPDYCPACDAIHIGRSCGEYCNDIKKTRHSQEEKSPTQEPCQKVFEKARIIPPALQNITVRVLSDGVWIGFKAKSGKQCAIHAGNMLYGGGQFPGLTGKVVEDWMQDMKDSPYAQED